MKKARIGIIGARRVRQGLGPFVARYVHAHGGEVAAFLGSRPGSVAEGERELAEAGIEARGYTDLEKLLDRESLDALAILSPSETHERYLAAALERRVHTLCEKPFLWGREGAAERARELCDGYAARGLLLRENCQWPWALPGHHELFPMADAEPVRSFEMRLTPLSKGETMLGDALPHPFSMLQRLCPGPEGCLDEIRFEEGVGGVALAMGFAYRTPVGSVSGRVELQHGTVQPREAWFSINGRKAVRRVRMRDYAIFLGAGDAEVRLADPLESHVRSFLTDLDAARGGIRPEPDWAIPHRARLLEDAVSAFRKDRS